MWIFFVFFTYFLYCLQNLIHFCQFKNIWNAAEMANSSKWKPVSKLWIINTRTNASQIQITSPDNRKYFKTPGWIRRQILLRLFYCFILGIFWNVWKSIMSQQRCSYRLTQRTSPWCIHLVVIMFFSPFSIIAVEIKLIN